MKKPVASARIMGFDLVRGLAVYGMFLMNFKLVMQNPDTLVSGFWKKFLEAGEGCFGVLFIILAGISVSLRKQYTTLYLYGANGADPLCGPCFDRHGDS